MIKFCMLSTKGGVGKTTLAASLGGLFADMGLRVLLIDAEGAIQHKLAIRADGMLRLSRALASPIMSDDNYDVVIIDARRGAHPSVTPRLCRSATQGNARTHFDELLGRPEGARCTGGMAHPCRSSRRSD